MLNFNSIKSKIRQPSKKTAISLTIIISILLALIISLVRLSAQGTTFLTPVETIPADLPEAPTPTAVKSEDITTLNVLLLGYGGAGHQGGYLADVIMLVHLDLDANTINYISIPRDLEVVHPDGSRIKINRALAQEVNAAGQPTGEVLKPTLHAITGLPIDYFIGVDFVGFQRLIGYELDGIQVKVEETLDDPWYPIRGQELNPCGMTPEEIAQLTEEYSGFQLEKQFPCRYQRIHYEPGIHHMEGGDALAFVRSRHSSSDFDRSRRQQIVLTAIRDKLISLDAFDNAPSIFNQLHTHISTNLDTSIIKHLTPALHGIGEYSTHRINLSTQNVLTESRSPNSGFILTPKSDWPQVHQYIQQQLNSAQ